MSTALEVIGGIAGTVAAAGALLGGDRRLRLAAILAALGFAAALVIGEAWNNQLSSLRDRPLELAALLVVVPLGLGLLAAVFRRRPILLPLGLIAVLPFRIPVDTGSETSYLLIPLYLVIAGGVVAEAVTVVRGDGRQIPPPAGAARWLAVALSASMVLYALQTIYSTDVTRATQNIAFFLIPFSILFSLLREVEWDPRLLRYVIFVVAGEALILAGIGIVQHEARHIFWNPKAMESNEFDLNFRVNSLFWDPNIYARYLALTIAMIVGALVWVRDRRWFAAGTAVVAVIFLGMAFAFSQTSYFALLAAVVVLCALRWSLRWTAIGTGVAVLAAAAFIVLDRSAVEVHTGKGDSTAQTTSGRSRLASGGLKIAKARPLEGYGSGSFAVEFAKRNELTNNEAAVSHTEPITVAAEQGGVGVVVYIGVLLASIGLLVGAGLRDVAPGLGGKAPPEVSNVAARVAIAAAFGGLVIHSLGYAGFLTDPLTWALLAVGSALATLRP